MDKFGVYSPQILPKLQPLVWNLHHEVLNMVHTIIDNAFVAQKVATYQQAGPKEMVGPASETSHSNATHIGPISVTATL